MTGVSNELMSALLFAIAALLFTNGYMLNPILARLGITQLARWSVALFFVATGTYMAWIGTLFARDQLPHTVNYDWPIVLIRVALLASLVGLTVQVFRNLERDDSL